MRQYGYLATDGLEQPAQSPDIKATPNAANPQRNIFSSPPSEPPLVISPFCGKTSGLPGFQPACEVSIIRVAGRERGFGRPQRANANRAGEYHGPPLRIGHV